jgi:hypothetical protein
LALQLGNPSPKVAQQLQVTQPLLFVRTMQVLIMGCKNVLGVAKSYGFTRPLLVDDLAFDQPSRFPFFHFPEKILAPPIDGSEDNRIHAVLILHDPIHWGVDLQIAIDVIRGGTPLGSGAGQAIPVFACNPDMVFAGAYPVPVREPMS